MDYSTNVQEFPGKETKAEKFRRLSNARLNKIVYSLRLLSNLSNTSNYEFTSDDVTFMFKVIERELKLCEASFNFVVLKYLSKEGQ